MAGGGLGRRARVAVDATGPPGGAPPTWDRGTAVARSVNKRSLQEARRPPRYTVPGRSRAGDEDELRRRSNMSIERTPMSREGYEKRKAELDRMQNGEMREVTRRIAAARDLGDLSENAEYHAAREDQGMLQARIDKLKDELS